MKPKWFIWDREYDKDGNIKLVRYACLECPEICCIPLPANKTPYHCLKEGQDESKRNKKV